jgi:hypothetical protein
MIRVMGQPEANPREGGVKIVFDVRQEVVDVAIAQVSAAGFEVRRYYPAGDEPRRGGSGAGYVRLGAERPMIRFAESEQAEIISAFEAVREARALSCTVIGVDIWTAGGSAGLAGVREPRRPLPTADTPGAVRALPGPTTVAAAR